MTNGLNKNGCPMEKDGIIFNLKKGLEAEDRAMEACQNLLPLLDNNEDKKEIFKIIQDEKRHIEIVKQLIETVTKYYHK